MRKHALAAIVYAIIHGMAVGYCQPAYSQDSDARSSPLPSHFPLGVEACFGRTYDAAHLKSHPKQRVTSFHIFRDFTPDQNTEMEASTREQLVQDDGSNGNVAITAFVRFRDRKGVFSNGLGCRKSDEGKVICAIDCDGGSFWLRPSGPSLIVDNEGFVVVGGCGASDDEQDHTEHVKPGADDKTFRLDKQPLAQCVALRTAQAPVWAKLGKPLRARFTRDKASCFARSYDAAHLRANPKQNVRRISVLKAANSRGAGDDGPDNKFLFRIETKDGRTFENSAFCAPDNYAYACTSPQETNGAHDFYLTRAGGDVMLRDRKGVLANFLAAGLGEDDRMFRLRAAPESACTF